MRQALVWLAATCALASPCAAWQIRARMVLRTGTETGYDPIYVWPGSTGMIRIQLGVFDDVDGPAPAGGLIGWTMGTLSGAGTNGSGATRLNPFASSPAPGFSGTQVPLDLFDIDATLGTQSLPWLGIPGTSDPGPQPAALVRGRNTFISVFQFLTIAGGSDYVLTAAGGAVAASAWDGTPLPPQPGPDGFFGPGDQNHDNIDDTLDDLPGSITYSHVDLPPIPFSALMHVIIVPAPATAPTLMLHTVIALRRRRARPTQ